MYRYLQFNHLTYLMGNRDWEQVLFVCKLIQYSLVMLFCVWLIILLTHTQEVPSVIHPVCEGHAGSAGAA